MTMPEDKDIAAGTASPPKAVTSRRRAVGVVGTSVVAGIAGAAMPALGAQSSTATPLRIPLPQPAEALERERAQVFQICKNWACRKVFHRIIFKPTSSEMQRF